MAAAPASIGAGPAKLKIKIKGLSVLGVKQRAGQRQGSTGFKNGLSAVVGDQLADLHAAVEAFCQQGLRGLPGAVLLSPWREPSPVEQLAPWRGSFPPQEQQGNGFSLFAQQQQPAQEQQPLQQEQQPTQRRVRKRRAPEPQQHAGDGTVAELQDPHHLAWGNLKRQRSNPQRAARDAAQLSNGIHSMLHEGSGDAAAAAPASPSVVSQPRAAGAAAAGAHPPASSSGKTAAAAGGHRPSRLQRSTSRLASPALAAAAPAPAEQKHAPPAVSAAEPEAVAMEVDEPATVAAAEPAPAAAGAAAEPGDAPEQQQKPQQEQPQQQDSKPQQQSPQRQEAKQELQAEAKEMQQSPEQQVQEQQQQQQQKPQQQSGRKRQPDPLPPHKQKQQRVVKQDQPKPLAPSDAAMQPSNAAEVAAEQPAVVAAAVEPTAPAAAAAEADLKPESPPSETSHQQHMPAPQQLQQQLLPCAAEQQPAAAGKQQHQQQECASPGAPDLQIQQQVKQPEQTAVSRDRSQCSLPRTADPVGAAAAVSMPAPAAAVPATRPSAAGGSSSTSGAAGRSSGRLLELAPGAMTPAARALAVLSAVPEVRQRVLPPDDRPVRTQEEAQAYLQTILAKAKQFKHQGDRRHHSLNGWDVFGLSFYALSSVEFLMYWDTLLRLLNKLRAANQPVDKLQQLVYSLSGVHGAPPFLRQTGNMSGNGMGACNNCKGPDMAKSALRMLLERISAISNLRNLHNQRKQLEAHIRLLKSNGASFGSGSSSGAGSSMRSAAAAPQQQQQQAVAAQQQAAQLQTHRAGAAPGAGKPPSPGGSSWSPVGANGAQQQQQFNKRSPDDSNASNQDRVQLLVGGELVGGAGVGAAAGGGAAQGGQTERALALAKSERALMDSMQELLKLTDSMHQTVMRVQQFLERPEVLASEHLRAAALHISVLGLDGGMFSIPRVAAHTEAAVTCITKFLRSS